MILDLEPINDDATLNAYSFISNFRFVPGDDVKLLMVIVQPDKKIRYVPESGATIEFDFLKSDGTNLLKTATFPFADDRSIIQVELTAVETATLISQNLIAKITETTGITRAWLQNGFQLVNITGEC